MNTMFCSRKSWRREAKREATVTVWLNLWEFRELATGKKKLGNLDFATTYHSESV